MLAFRVLFCFLYLITYSAICKICFLSLPYKFSDFLVVFLSCFKKCQGLAFQLLNCSITFHCCSYVLLCGSCNPTDHFHLVKVAPVILLFLPWDYSDNWKLSDLYIRLRWSNWGQKIRMTASASKLHGGLMFVFS